VQRLCSARFLQISEVILSNFDFSSPSVSNLPFARGSPPRPRGSPPVPAKEITVELKFRHVVRIHPKSRRPCNHQQPENGAEFGLATATRPIAPRVPKDFERIRTSGLFKNGLFGVLARRPDSFCDVFAKLRCGWL
jgi:hypothetical protein